MRPSRNAARVLVVAGLAGAVALGTAIDRGQPGTSVGEAEARSLLSASADAAGDGTPTGWRWTRTVTVERRTVEGERCRACPTERGVVEQTFVEDVWTGDGGEAYRFSTGKRPRAIENAPLLRAGGLLAAPRSGTADRGVHVPPVPPGALSGDAAGLGLPGWVADPPAVPSDPNGTAHWARVRIAAQDRAWRKRARAGQGRMASGQARDERVAATLVDLATSPQLSGSQKASAFEALASLTSVTADAVPPAFAGRHRVAVRIAGGRAGKASPFPRPDRIVVFDRARFRVVAEQIDDRERPVKATVVFSGPKATRRMRMISGGSGERRYLAPVSVAAPGLDAHGRRRFDVSAPIEVARDGRGVAPPKVPKRSKIPGRQK